MKSGRVVSVPLNHALTLRSKLLLILLPFSQDQDLNHFCPELFQIAAFASAMNGTCRATSNSYFLYLASGFSLGPEKCLQPFAWVCPSVFLHSTTFVPSTLLITAVFLFFLRWFPDWNSLLPLDFEVYENKTVSITNQNFIPVHWLAQYLSYSRNSIVIEHIMNEWT